MYCNSMADKDVNMSQLRQGEMDLEAVMSGDRKSEACEVRAPVERRYLKTTEAQP